MLEKIFKYIKKYILKKNLISQYRNHAQTFSNHAQSQTQEKCFYNSLSFLLPRQEVFSMKSVLAAASHFLTLATTTAAWAARETAS